jgi:hypothetical protein
LDNVYDGAQLREYISGFVEIVEFHATIVVVVSYSDITAEKPEKYTARKRLATKLASRWGRFRDNEYREVTDELVVIPRWVLHSD